VAARHCIICILIAGLHASAYGGVAEFGGNDGAPYSPRPAPTPQSRALQAQPSLEFLGTDKPHLGTPRSSPKPAQTAASSDEERIAGTWKDQGDPECIITFRSGDISYRGCTRWRRVGYAESSRGLRVFSASGGSCDTFVKFFGTQVNLTSYDDGCNNFTLSRQ
jgi:hypothetical protein